MKNEITIHDNEDGTYTVSEPTDMWDDITVDTTVEALEEAMGMQFELGTDFEIILLPGM